MVKSPSDFKFGFISDPTLSESALFSGQERSLRSSASIISDGCDVGAVSLRSNPAGRLCRAPRTSFIIQPPANRYMPSLHGGFSPFLLAFVDIGCLLGRIRTRMLAVRYSGAT